MDEFTNEPSEIPQQWRTHVTAQLQAGETVLSCFQPNLDAARLNYADEIVVLTNRRLLHGEREGVAPRRLQRGDGNCRWKSWPLESVSTLRARDRAGLGTLELEQIGRAGRQAHWRYTIGHASGAHRLVERFQAWRSGGQAKQLAATVCPSCGAALAADQKVCPACTPATHRPKAAALYRLVRFARPRAHMIALGFILTLASTAAGMVWPYLQMPLVDKILIPYQNRVPVNFRLAHWYLIGMALSAVVAWLLTWARTYVLAWASERVAADLRNSTYAHLQRLSLEYFGGKRTGDIIARISNDTDRICNFLSINLLDFASDVVMMGMTAVVLLGIDPALAVVTLCPFPIIFWLVTRARGQLKRGFQRSNRAWGEMTSVLADAIPGIRVIKAFAQEQREIDRFRRSNDHVLQANDRLNKVWSYFGPLLSLLTQLGLSVVWAFGVWLVFKDPKGSHITVGMLTTFITYISRFYLRLESMTRMVQATQRAGSSAQRIFEILDRVPSVAEPLRPVHPGRLRGEVELRGVGFRYGNRQVLHDLNVTIKPGEMIGLVGSSGAGKTTLVNLVCRFYDVGEGAIVVDGVDIRSFPIEEYRRHIGIVLQDPFLFYGTVAENIAYGRPNATRTEVVAAAKAARAHEFILRLAEGYDSLVGERGQSLSGGERQRVSIARAILIDPRILILDEATSSVDSETEQEIQEALDNLILGRTTIAIAHRLSTLSRADRLVVLEQGRIVEVGQHQELLDLSGAYARLHRAQAELAQSFDLK